MPLEPRFGEPSGWHWGRMEPRANQSVRYGWCLPQKTAPKALCLILPGLSEYCEKYFEVAHDLLARGLAVAVLDWRGQGLSWNHLPDNDKRHHDDFANDALDATALLETLQKTPQLAGIPLMLLGHSLGGHVALRLLHDLKDVFRCAVLTAPMFGINLPLLAEGPARLTAEAACRMGWADHYVPGAGPWSLPVFTNNLNLLSSDTDRRAMQKHWLTEKPALRMGGLTYGWLRATLASIRLTQNPVWLADIHTPVLTFLSGREMIVSNPAAQKGLAAMPAAQMVEVDGALHEILMERDVFRNVFWRQFDSFVDKHLTPM